MNSSLATAARLHRMSTATLNNLISSLTAECRRVEMRAHQDASAAQIVTNLELELAPIVDEQRRREGIAA